MNKDFFLSKGILLHISLSCLIAVAISFHTVLSRSGKKGHLHLVADLRKNIDNTACYGFLIDAHYQKESPFIFHLLKFFIRNRCYIFLKCFSMLSGFSGGKLSLQLCMSQDGWDGVFFSWASEDRIFGPGNSSNSNSDTSDCSHTWAISKLSLFRNCLSTILSVFPLWYFSSSAHLSFPCQNI